MDNVDKKTRSYIMSKIKNKNTRPERLFRMALVRDRISGFKVNYKAYKGIPDFIFIRVKVVVFIDGCFWHGLVKFKAKSKFWRDKIARNVERDKIINKYYRKLGYKVVRFTDIDMNKILDKCILKTRGLVYGKNKS